MDIRLATVSDAPAVAAIYRPYVHGTVTSFELEAPTEAEMAERIRRTLEQKPWLVALERGAVIAYAYASRHHARAAYQWSVDSAVYVRPEQQRRGLARTLYAELFARLIEQGYYTVFAGISLPNPASVAFHERLGFTPVGVYRKAGFKFGAWHDVGWWQRPLRNYGIPWEAPRMTLRP